MFPEKPKRSPEKAKRKRKRYPGTNQRLRLIVLIAILIVIQVGVVFWFYLKAETVPPSAAITPARFSEVNTPQSGPAAAEQLTVRFDKIDSISTQNRYSGTVQLDIRGTGQAAGTDWSDAFYQYTLNNAPLIEPITHHFDLEIDGGRAIDTLGVQDNPPPYNIDHHYTVSYDVGPEPRPIRFRISDSIVDDNTGYFEITVTQQ